MTLIWNILFSLILLLHLQIAQIESQCNTALLANYNDIPDSAFQATSSEPNFEVKWIRKAASIDQGWCPKNEVENKKNEYITVDLQKIHFLKVLMFNGLHKAGYYSAEGYYVEYKREANEPWRKYILYKNETNIKGNSDHFTETIQGMSPIIIARWIKIYPFNNKATRICMKLEIYGCPYDSNIIEYTVVDGSSLYHINDWDYDGQKASNMLRNGLGRLVLGKINAKPTMKSEIISPDGDPFIEKFRALGWNKIEMRLDYITILFRFDSIRNFTRLDFDGYIYREKKVDLPKQLSVQFSIDGMDFGDEQNDQIIVKIDREIDMAQRIAVDLRYKIGQYVKLKLWFKNDWIVIKSLFFISSLSNDIIPPKPPKIISTKPTPITTTQIVIIPNFPGNQFFSPKLAYILIILAILIFLLLLIAIPCATFFIRRQRSRNKKCKEAIQKRAFIDEQIQLFSPPFQTFKDYPIHSSNNGPSVYALNTYQHPNMITTLPNMLSGPPPDSIYTSLAGSDTDSICPNTNYDPRCSISNLAKSTSNMTLNPPSLFNVPPPPPPLNSNNTNTSLHYPIQPPTSSSSFLIPISSSNINPLPNDFSTTSFMTLNRLNQRPNHVHFYPIQINNNSNTTSSNTASTNSTATYTSYYPHHNNQNQMTRSQLNLRQPYDPVELLDPRQTESGYQSFSICAPTKTDIRGCLGNSKLVSINDDNNSSILLSADLSHKKSSFFNFSLDKLKSISPLYSTKYGSINIAEFSLPKNKKKLVISSKDDSKKQLISVNETNEVSNDDDDYDDDDDDDGGGGGGSGINGRNDDNKLTKNNNDSNNENVSKYRNYNDNNNKNENNSMKYHNIKQIVCIRSIAKDVSKHIKKEILEEILRISQMNHINFPATLKLNEQSSGSSSIMLITEYSDLGDLHSFLRQNFINQPSNSIDSNHNNTVVNNNLTDNLLNLKNIGHLDLIDWACQVSSGMTYLHDSLLLIHRDLSCRNLLLHIDPSRSIIIKISDLAICQSKFIDDYYSLELSSKNPIIQTPLQRSISTGQFKTNQSNGPINGDLDTNVLLPIRWMPWEAVLKGDYSTKSDVYSFGVLFWELFTYCRIQPLSEMTNEQVIINHNLHALNDDRGRNLPFIPTAKEYSDFINHCTNRIPSNRPSFKEIFNYLQYQKGTLV